MDVGTYNKEQGRDKETHKLKIENSEFAYRYPASANMIEPLSRKLRIWKYSWFWSRSFCGRSFFNPLLRRTAQNKHGFSFRIKAFTDFSLFARSVPPSTTILSKSPLNLSVFVFSHFYVSDLRTWKVLWKFLELFQKNIYYIYIFPNLKICLSLRDLCLPLHTQ